MREPLRYALIDKDGLVVNVILCDPDNLCSDHTDANGGCLKWHAPEGYTCAPAGEGLNTTDHATRPASPGDRAVKVMGRRSVRRPYDFIPAPKDRTGDPV